MKTNAIDKPTLEKLYIQEKLSDEEISKITKTSRRNVTRLRSVYEIKSFEDYERHPYHSFTDEEKQIILGSILGDGHIRLRKNATTGTAKQNYPQLMFAQSTKHEEYFYWFKEKMNRWIYDNDKPIPIRANRNPLYKSPAYSRNLSTICHPVFNEFHQGFYKDGIKIVNFELLEKYFTELTLAIWIMDDGGMTGLQPRIRIATNGFTKTEVEGLSSFLARKYNLKAWVSKATTKKKETYELIFNKESTDKISNMVRNIIVPSMQYKLSPPN